MRNLNNPDSKSIEQVASLNMIIVIMKTKEFQFYILLKGSFCNLNID